MPQVTLTASNVPVTLRESDGTLPGSLPGTYETLIIPLTFAIPGAMIGQSARVIAGTLTGSTSGNNFGTTTVGAQIGHNADVSGPGGGLNIPYTVSATALSAIIATQTGDHGDAFNAQASETFYFQSAIPITMLGVPIPIVLEIDSFSLTFEYTAPMTTFGCSASDSDSNGAALVTVTLKDGSGNPTPAPVGGQVFLLATNAGTLSATSLFVPQGAMSGSVGLQGSVTGTATVTIQAGAGPVLGQANCIVSVGLVVPPAPTLDGGTPDLCLIRETRANWRDTLRRSLGITVPIDQYGASAVPGEEPFGESYPSNAVLNQAIAHAFQFLGRECHWHKDVRLSIDVAATADPGAQFVSLTGVGGSPYQTLINTVDRLVFQDNSGVVYRLRARDYAALDRNRHLYDNNPSADIPREFFITAGEIGLLPGAVNGGTLRVYADTALIGFCSDDDVVDELPLDYHPVVQDIARMYVLQMHPSDPDRREQAQALQPLVMMGIKQIKLWLITRNRDQQYSLVPVTRRRRRW